MAPVSSLFSTVRSVPLLHISRNSPLQPLQPWRLSSRINLEQINRPSPNLANLPLLASAAGCRADTAQNLLNRILATFRHSRMSLRGTIQGMGEVSTSAATLPHRPLLLTGSARNIVARATARIVAILPRRLPQAFSSEPAKVGNVVRIYERCILTYFSRKLDCAGR